MIYFLPNQRNQYRALADLGVFGEDFPDLVGETDVLGALDSLGTWLGEKEMLGIWLSDGADDGAKDSDGAEEADGIDEDLAALPSLGEPATPALLLLGSRILCISTLFYESRQIITCAEHHDG